MYTKRTYSTTGRYSVISLSSITPLLPHPALPLPLNLLFRGRGQPTTHSKRFTQQGRRLIFLMPGRTDGNITYSWDVTIGLIDIQAVNRPESVRKSGWVVLHVIDAGIGEGRAVGARVPHFSGPIAAEVCIEDLVACFLVVIAAYGGWCGKEEEGFHRKDGERKRPHNLHVRKVTWDVAIPPILRDRLFPRRRVRCSSFEIWGRRPTREEPDADIATGPLHGNDTTSVGIEIVTVRFRVLVLNVAAGVV